METIKNKSLEDGTDLNSKNEQRDFIRTFGQKVVEVSKEGDATKNADIQYREYIERIQKERALLETLNAEKKENQNYIFWKTIEENPEVSQFVKKIFRSDETITPVSRLLKKNEDGSYQIPDEALGNILEVYQNVLEKEEDRLAGEVEKTQLKYESNLKNIVEMGRLPRELYDNYNRVKRKNGGSIVGTTRLFDSRPAEYTEAYLPAGTVAFIEHQRIDGTNEKGEIVNSEDIKTLYRKAVLYPVEKMQLISLDTMLSHEFTHIIAGTEASFNLLPSESGSVNIPDDEMDAEGLITMAYREGMTEAIGQMIIDSSPEADSRDLGYYLTNRTGTYRSEREFLAGLIKIDSKNNNQLDDNEQETLEDIMLKAYGETDDSEYIDQLRKKFRLILNDLERIIEDAWGKNNWDEYNKNLVLVTPNRIAMLLEIYVRDKIDKQQPDSQN